MDWISVEEWLPEDNKAVFVWTLYEQAKILYHSKNKWWEYDLDKSWEHSYVTHWMPLPPSPQESEVG